MGDLTSPPEPANRVQTPLVDALEEKLNEQWIEWGMSDDHRMTNLARQLETDRAECIRGLLDIEMETRKEGQWTLAEINEVARNVLSRLSPAPQPTEGGKNG